MEDKIKIINKIVWWIPVKNLRNLIRDILVNISNIEKIENIIIDNNSIAMTELILEKMFHRRYEYINKYKNIFLNIKENDVCIDCGANNGIFTRLIDIQKGICYSFEPNEGLYRQLKKRYKNNDNIFIYNQAVSNKNEMVKFYKTDNDYNLDSEGFTISHSKLNTNFVEVETIKLTEFIKNNILNKHSSIYMLKIDIEGAEFDVVDDIIEEEIYTKIKYIFVETHERFFDDGIERLNKIKSKIEKRNIENIFLDWV